MNSGLATLNTIEIAQKASLVPEFDRLLKKLPEQQQEYLSVFGRYIVAVYAERFSNYQGQTFKVLNAEQRDAQTSVVHSQLTQLNGQPPVAIRMCRAL